MQFAQNVLHVKKYKGRENRYATQCKLSSGKTRCKKPRLCNRGSGSTIRFVAVSQGVSVQPISVLYFPTSLSILEESATLKHSQPRTAEEVEYREDSMTFHWFDKVKMRLLLSSLFDYY